MKQRTLHVSTIVIMAVCAHLFAEPKPGEVFRVYHKHAPRWIVSNCGASYCHGNSPHTSTFDIDINNATRIELAIDLWGGHIGSKKTVEINGGSPVELVQPNTPTSPECYYYDFQGAFMELPLSQFKNGRNDLTFRAGSVGGCKGQGAKGWYWLYSLTMYVYYDAGAVTHTTGSVVSPGSGAAIADNPQFSLELDGSAADVDSVIYICRYDDFPYKGTGVYRDWHFRQTPRSYSFNSAGVSTAAPYTATWDTEWIPDQPNSMNVAAWIVRKDGIRFMTRAVDGITFNRNRSIRMYKPSNVSEKFGSAFVRTCDVPIGDDVTQASRAILRLSTWSGGGDTPHRVWINETLIPGTKGAFHKPAIIRNDIPLDALRKGNNEFKIDKNKSGVHAFEINWPGPVFFVEYEKMVDIRSKSTHAQRVTIRGRRPARYYRPDGRRIVTTRSARHGVVLFVGAHGRIAGCTVHLAK